MRNESVNNIIPDIEAKAKEKGGYLVPGQSYTSYNTPLHFVCANKHDFELTSTLFICKNKWCPVCSGHSIEAKKYRIEKALKTLVDPISKEPVSVEILDWSDDYRSAHVRCHNGHEIDLNLVNSKTLHWCKECYKERAMKAFLDKLREEEPSIQLIDTEFKGRVGTYRALCNGHEVSINYNNYMNGLIYACPKCSSQNKDRKKSKSKFKCRNI